MTTNPSPAPEAKAGEHDWRYHCEQGKRRCENFMRGLGGGSPFWVMFDAVRMDFIDALAAKAADAALELHCGEATVRAVLADPGDTAPNHLLARDWLKLKSTLDASLSESARLAAMVEAVRRVLADRTYVTNRQQLNAVADILASDATPATAVSKAEPTERRES